MGVAETVMAIVSLVGVGSKLVVDLIAGKITPEQARASMLDEVTKFVADVADGGAMDQALAANYKKFEDRIAAIEARDKPLNEARIALSKLAEIAALKPEPK